MGFDLVDLFADEELLPPGSSGINPRGLVPVLVHDGAVHIENDDIIQYLEQKFPTPKLIPAGHENEVAGLLKHEDDLHLDLRTLSFRFEIESTRASQACGDARELCREWHRHLRAKDRDKEIQIEFWQRAAKEGFTDERARASAQKFRVAFDALEQRLAQHPYLMGDKVPGARHRLVHLRPPAVAGDNLVYAVPRVATWMEKLRASPEFATEIAMPPEAVTRLEATRRSQVEAGKSLEAVAGF